mmetsp:Transcript_20753/g.34210  ORF Transcript_20753/g.34210 Transcript_20753/m.34210 type:complete len:733 (-) Transcript_20753:75-2273(-)
MTGAAITPVTPHQEVTIIQNAEAGVIDTTEIDSGNQELQERLDVSASDDQDEERDSDTSPSGLVFARGDSRRGAVHTELRQTMITDKVPNFSRESEFAMEASMVAANSSRYVLHPHSLLRLYWDCLVSIGVLYTAIALPLQLCFASLSSLWWICVDQAVNLFFFVDFILNLHTGFENPKTRELVLATQPARLHYLRTWGVPDLIATVPFGCLDLVSSDLRWLRAFKLFRLCRALRLSRIKSQLQLRSGMDSTVSAGLQFCASAFLCAHWICCLWFAIGKAAVVRGHVSWLGEVQLEDGSVGDQYTASLYWALTSMSTIGYGDISAESMAERLFSCAVMVVGTSFYSVGITTVVSHITGGHSFYAKLLQQKELLNSYMAEAHTPIEIRTTIREYLMHYQAAAMTFNEQAVLTMLSPGLQAKVSSSANEPLIRRVPFFKMADTSCICEVMLVLQPHLFPPDEIIVRQGNIAKDMFIIKLGVVSAFVDTNSGETQLLARLRTGDFFGEGALLTSADHAADPRRGATIKARTFTVVYSLNADVVHEILENYPDVRDAIYHVAQERKAQTVATAFKAKIGKYKMEREREHQSEHATVSEQLLSTPCGEHILSKQEEPEVKTESFSLERQADLLASDVVQGSQMKARSGKTELRLSVPFIGGKVRRYTTNGTQPHVSAAVRSVHSKVGHMVSMMIDLQTELDDVAATKALHKAAHVFSTITDVRLELEALLQKLPAHK